MNESENSVRKLGIRLSNSYGYHVTSASHAAFVATEKRAQSSLARRRITPRLESYWGNNEAKHHTGVRVPIEYGVGEAEEAAADAAFRVGLIETAFDSSRESTPMRPRFAETVNAAINDEGMTWNEFANLSPESRLELTEKMVRNHYYANQGQITRNVSKTFRSASSHTSISRSVAARSAIFLECVLVLTTHDPTMIPGDIQIQWGQIGEFESKEEIDDFIVQMYVQRVSWRGGLDQQLAFFKKHGLELAISDTDIATAAHSESFRNAIEHNAGRVNETLVRRTGDTSLEIGSALEFTNEDVWAYFAANINVSGALVRATAEAIGVSDNSFPTTYLVRHD